METLSFDVQKFRALKVRVRTTHLELGNRDQDIFEAFTHIAENVEDFHAGAASSRRGLFVIGESGSGKSSLIAHHLKTFPDFQPRMGKHGRLTQPYLSTTVPKKCQSRDITREIVKAMGLPYDGNESDLTETMLEQFKERETIVLHLDEMQHSIRSNSSAIIKAVQDWLKSLLQLKDWPLHIIVSGMPTLKPLLAPEGQVGRRSKVIELHDMACPADLARIKFYIEKVVVEGCGLTLGPDVKSDDFYARLCHAASGAFGNIIEITQESCFRALRRQRSEVNLRHFINEYEDNTGCLPTENVFNSPDWKQLKSHYGRDEEK